MIYIVQIICTDNLLLALGMCVALLLVLLGKLSLTLILLVDYLLNSFSCSLGLLVRIERSLLCL